jgi:hypothetical protein
MEMKSDTEKENKDTNNNYTHAESHHCTVKFLAHLLYVPEIPHPNLISGASHPDRILVVFLVPPADIW